MSRETHGAGPRARLDAWATEIGRYPAINWVASDSRRLVTLGLAAASLLCAATLEAEVHQTGNSFYRFLHWNLFLAWVPLLAAFGASAASRHHRGGLAVCLGVVWLVFFPNAPYVLTDFIHLGDPGTSSGPLWYVALMLSSFAWTALLLGFFSLYVMQALWRRALGFVGSWIAVVVVLALSALGVYLGRFGRFNSWDLVVRPGRVADVVAHGLDNPFSNLRLIGVLLVLTAFLVVGYAIVCAFAGLRAAMKYRPQ